ncbi:unnamed protein product [Closterium sp. NIES-64]|nr:unnamed protein product [Closterium sp. NIES-64]
MPPRKNVRGKGKEKVPDDEPIEDSPYVACMKAQQKEGKAGPSIKRLAKPWRDYAGASSSRVQRNESGETGGDTDVSDDDLEEIVFESGSEDDSDNSKGASDEDDNDSDGGDDASGAHRRTGGSRRDRRQSTSSSKRKWEMHELVSLAAARWNMKDDLKAMQGKQGSQYWKKLRAHMKEKDSTWDRESVQMSMAWKRIEKEYLDTQRKEGTSGGKAIKNKPWWDYVYHLRKHSAKAKAHALDGGGAATINVDAYASVPAQNDPQSSGAPAGDRVAPEDDDAGRPGANPPELALVPPCEGHRPFSAPIVLSTTMRVADWT